jgi:hypothetical protein
MASSSKIPLPVPAADFHSTFWNTWRGAFNAVNKFFGHQDVYLIGKGRRKA